MSCSAISRSLIILTLFMHYADTKLFHSQGRYVKRTPAEIVNTTNLAWQSELFSSHMLTDVPLKNESFDYIFLPSDSEASVSGQNLTRRANNWFSRTRPRPWLDKTKLEELTPNTFVLMIYGWNDQRKHYRGN